MQLEFIETGACGEKYVLWLMVGVSLSYDPSMHRVVW